MKIKIILYILFFSLLLFRGNLAQTTKRQNNEVGISIGLTSYSVKDQLASPLNYSGIYIPFGFSYFYKSLLNYHRFSLGYNSQTKLKSRISSSAAHIAEFSYANLQYEYARHITGFFNNKLRLYLGGKWNNNFTVREYSFSKYNGEASGEVFSSIGLLLLSNYEYSDETNMQISLSFPLLSYIVRSPYSLKDEPILEAIIGDSPFTSVAKLGSFHSLNNLKMFNTSLVLIQSLSSSFNVRFGWELSYFWFREPKSINSVAINYDVSILYRF
ncbi:MAG: hypothetical protein L3J41_17000 [Melioribacteraceae bacterium]|nr:hypothetical protein [Melioribacteraceae bacterium]